jgi:3-isopropylmalate dehydrogenase
MILSAKMMLDWLGERYDDPKCIKAAAAIEEAVIKTLIAKNTVPDLGGKKTTMGMAEAIAANIIQG